MKKYVRALKFHDVIQWMFLFNSSIIKVKENTVYLYGMYSTSACNHLTEARTLCLGFTSISMKNLIFYL